MILDENEQLLDMILNKHQQLLDSWKYSAKRLNDRAIDEFIGISRGLIADRVINQQEAAFLQSWLEANISYCSDPIVNQLYRRVQEMLIDGVLDQDEQEELFQILAEFTGESAVTHYHSLTPTLPLCSPPPKIEFPTMTFCLAGRFAYGPHRICEEVILERGGFVAKSVTREVDYLVIGAFCSTDWLHTSYGLKIKKAVALREDKGKIAIISEDHWAQSAFML